MSIVESKEILDLEAQIRDMQANAPQEYAYEGDKLERRLRLLRVVMMERIIEDYEKQNPKKFDEVKTVGDVPGGTPVPTKREVLNKKLEDLKADLAAWDESHSE